MPRFLIERQLPGAGDLTADQLQGIARKSCDVLSEMGPSIEWHHSYVLADTVYCVYDAPNEDAIRSHAHKGGFPVDRVSEITTMISPATAA